MVLARQFTTQEVSVIHRKTCIRTAACLILTLLVCLSILPMEARADSEGARPGIVSISSGWLNVRSSPSTGAAVAASLKKGSYVTLVSRSGDWWRVEYADGKYGYCHGDYITTASGRYTTVQTQSGRLNVRSGAGTSYSKTGSLPKGEGVLALSESGGWSRILYHGTKTGYVSSQYLSVKYSGVSLGVPSYKQTDSRWANVQVAQSGKTMAQIGCATTAIAMLESYRSGTAIYPDAMAKRLKYTPSGDVYWPGDYVTVSDGTGYLRKIYNLLRQGKPVLFGARNAYGKQHWVVIRGYAGGNALTASGFSILDPGSGSRSTLQQFLDVYPTFYKYFHF